MSSAGPVAQPDAESVTGPVMIVGGSVAGYTVASRLRQHGFTAPITLIDPEGLPYERPPLSKQLLLGETGPEDLALADTSWFTEHEVELVHARVESLRLGPAGAEHTLTLDDGAELTAATVVLATGATPISLGVEVDDDAPSANDPSADPRVLTLRHRDDVTALRQILDAAHHTGRPARIAVVGAGVLGAELASSLTELGAEVVLFAGPGIPASALFGRRIAARLHAQHTEHGVHVIPEYAGSVRLHSSSNTKASSDPTSTGVEILTLSGAAVPADAVISAIGISPNTWLAEECGLELADGIIVDADQRASHPDVFAVGDVARHEQAPRRTEHWQHAIDTATTAAAVIAEATPPSPGPEWFWSDRYGVHVEAIGTLRPAAADHPASDPPATGYTVVHREDPAHPEKLATFVLDDAGLMIGAASINDPLAVRAARRIIQRGLVVDPDQLADPEVSYKAMAR
ncbi:NAD(P)/FAD-dependent oxidoreductase [Citricoccus sp. NR2]|uniref:NAD(P)/FAD-dependent oxidoreductase n=1 Tax=Citricoccus sp. NR2 TaxID=3004095 RepID=UPI0022DD5D34|nr:FAD-dependent oxidoreductase [Citricoccus sp. NR2]WBL19250.1 FAD-dependent oxidoreductase [Citricoccus sp. NR2]